MGVYLDCAATTPIDPHVLEVCVRYLRDDFGNAASRTHQQGAVARWAVEHARDQVAAAAGASRGDVLFTGGATESNNLAILGLAAEGRRHVVTTAIEHSAVLEPMGALERRGFRVTYVRPGVDGAVDAQEIAAAVGPDTLLVSVMQVNNETGVLQPLAEIGELLADKPVYFHTDAAQGFSKLPAYPERLDLISISGHKLCAPKGVGALIVKRRGRERPPLKPLLFGGGHERGLRPGTLPVALIAALGEAAERWSEHREERWRQAVKFRQTLLEGLAPLQPVVNGWNALPFILNVGIPGHDSDSIMQAWEDLVAVSSGAACSSHSYSCSHVLAAMGRPGDNAIRFSFCHLSELPDLPTMVAALQEARVG